MSDNTDQPLEAEEQVDYTGRVGPLFPDHYERFPPEWPMYSFDRPSTLFWSGFANGLRERGLADKEIGDELRSKGTRWLLDEFGERLEELGLALARRYSLCVTEGAGPELPRRSSDSLSLAWAVLTGRGPLQPLLDKLVEDGEIELDGYKLVKVGEVGSRRKS